MNEILWEKWCREAAERAGITIEELKKRLAAGEHVLQITTVIDPHIRDRDPICHHGFTTPTICPICQHFDSIRKSEQEEDAAQKPPCRHPDCTQSRHAAASHYLCC